MAFPTSPTNGLTAVVNGITYVYSSTYGTWTIVPASGNIAINTDTFIGDGTTTAFTMSYAPKDANNVVVNINGVIQLLDAYTVTVDSTTITFSSPPTVNAKINTIVFKSGAVSANSGGGGSGTDAWVRTQANNAYDTANSAGSFANGAFTAANSATTTATSGASFANGAFLAANSATTTATSGASFANGAFTQANTATTTATSGASFANAAFTKANNALPLTGGTISGDVSVTGNLTIVGYNVFANTGSVWIKDNIITLNAAIDQASAPAFNAGVEVDRGSSANTYLLWNESTGKWTFTDNSSNYFNMADAARLDSSYAAANSGASFANGAFLAANAAYAQANSAASFANSAFITANSTTRAQSMTMGILFGA